MIEWSEGKAGDRFLEPSPGVEAELLAGGGEAGEDGDSSAAVTIYSITVTCKRLGLDPFRYLRDLLSAVSTHPAKDIDQLLPNHWAQPQHQSH